MTTMDQTSFALHQHGREQVISGGHAHHAHAGMPPVRLTRLSNSAQASARSSQVKRPGPELSGQVKRVRPAAVSGAMQSSSPQQAALTAAQGNTSPGATTEMPSYAPFSGMSRRNSSPSISSPLNPSANPSSFSPVRTSSRPESRLRRAELRRGSPRIGVGAPARASVSDDESDVDPSEYYSQRVEPRFYVSQYYGQTLPSPTRKASPTKPFFNFPRSADAPTVKQPAAGAASIGPKPANKSPLSKNQATAPGSNASPPAPAGSLQADVVAMARPTKVTGPSRRPPALSIVIPSDEEVTTLPSADSAKRSWAGRALSRHGSQASSPTMTMSPTAIKAAKLLSSLFQGRAGSPVAWFHDSPRPDDEEQTYVGLCRKCGFTDEGDMLQCCMCSTCFHASCEEPPIDWLPTMCFCSPGCFKRYKETDEGRRLFSEFAMLGTGHLRCKEHSFKLQQLPRARPLKSYKPVSRETRVIIPADKRKSGDCVRLRRRHTDGDSRDTWPAVIRHSFFDMKGERCYFVSWLREAKTAPPAPAPAPASDTQSQSDAGDDDQPSMVLLPNGKKGIMCTCGRVFSSGQALGGHRGKCKVPRERQRDRDARVRMGLPPVPTAAESSSQVVTSTTASGEPHPTHAFLLGDPEPLPQPGSAIVEDIDDVHLRIPADLRREHIIEAKRRSTAELRDECINDRFLQQKRPIPPRYAQHDSSLTAAKQGRRRAKNPKFTE